LGISGPARGPDSGNSAITTQHQQINNTDSQ